MFALAFDNSDSAVDSDFFNVLFALVYDRIVSFCSLMMSSLSLTVSSSRLTLPLSELIWSENESRKKTTSFSSYSI